MHERWQAGLLSPSSIMSDQFFNKVNFQVIFPLFCPNFQQPKVAVFGRQTNMSWLTTKNDERLNIEI